MKLQRMSGSVAGFAVILMLAAGAAHAATTTTPPPPPECLQPDNGTGTVTLPPAGCEYLSGDQVHMIIDGLPPGTTIILKPTHREFFCHQSAGGPCNFPGGPLGGEVENFNSVATFELSVSTSDPSSPLAGWSRTLSVPLAVQTATGPRTAGAAVQSFATDMQLLQGSISNDPDFDFFEVTGGTQNGFPSPGSTTLTRQANGTYRVDSSFRVAYSIYFKGAPGGKLAGFEGTTKGSANMQAVGTQASTGCK